MLKKWEKLLHCKSFSHFFNKEYWCISGIDVWKFNETLTNEVVSFEQPGPGLSGSGLKPHLRGGIFSVVNGLPLYTSFHYHLPIILIWLKYCWKIGGHSSIQPIHPFSSEHIECGCPGLLDQKNRPLFKHVAGGSWILNFLMKDEHSRHYACYSSVVFDDNHALIDIVLVECST